MILILTVIAMVVLIVLIVLVILQSISIIIYTTTTTTIIITTTDNVVLDPTDSIPDEVVHGTDDEEAGVPQEADTTTCFQEEVGPFYYLMR